MNGETNRIDSHFAENIGNTIIIIDGVDQNFEENYLK